MQWWLSERESCVVTSDEVVEVGLREEDSGARGV
jgi:hypothetical protein